MRFGGGILSIEAMPSIHYNYLYNNNGGAYSIEPGGQIEWASPPYRNLNDLNDSLNFHNSIFEQILKPHNFFIIPYGVDPFHKPEEIELINDPKYIIMDKMKSFNFWTPLLYIYYLSLVVFKEVFSMAPQLKTLTPRVVSSGLIPKDSVLVEKIMRVE